MLTPKDIAEMYWRDKKVDEGYKSNARPIIKDEDGTKRYKPNKVVSVLYDSRGKFDLNDIWVMYGNGLFSKEDMQEFYQLIGYSVGGYEEIWESR